MAKKSSQAAPAAPAGEVRTHAEGDWFARLAARKQELKIGLLIALAIWLIFGQTLGFAFLDYGDSAALTDNPLVQAGWTTVGLRYAFESYQTGAWQPVAWLSHMTDFAVLGLDAGAHHFVNVALHMLNSLLLFALLVKFSGARWRSGLVAFIFAVHPLQVEPVAWLSERRTLLAGFFGLVGMWAWLRSSDNKRWYPWSIVSYMLAVMSNAAVAPLALIYVLMDRWPAGRTPRWVAAIPLFGVGGAALGIWFWTLTQSGGTTPIPLNARVANALASIGEYLATVVWPQHLAAFYPARTAVPLPLVAAGVAVLVVLSAIAFWQRARRPFLITGWLWFLLLMVPVLGLVPVGALSRADRFMYLPLVGVLIGVVWSIHSVAAKWEKGMVIPLVAGLAVLLFTWTAWAQTSYWRGDIVLFEHALKVTGDANRVAHSQIGAALVRLNQVEYALQHLKRAIELDPSFAPSYRQMAEALYKREFNRGSLDMLNKAIALDPGSARLYADRGKVLRALDRLDEAYDSFEQGIKMGLDLTVQMDAYFNQGMIRNKQTRYPEAIERFQRALQVDPYFYLARKNLAFTYLRSEKYFDAEREFGLLVRTNPNDEDVVKATRFLRQRIK